jgi:hypothetical protein
MFWKKKSGVESLPEPEDIPEIVGRDLVIDLKQDPDWVWSPKVVLLPHPENKHRFGVRVFDREKLDQNDIKIKNYYSLEDYPDLILFSGWFDNNLMQGQIKDNRIKQSR